MGTEPKLTPRERGLLVILAIVFLIAVILEDPTPLT